eukprot:COSAG06_NODE_29806_length_550_cov_0.807095_1_plen_58_part_10
MLPMRAPVTFIRDRALLCALVKLCVFISQPHTHELVRTIAGTQRDIVLQAAAGCKRLS